MRPDPQEEGRRWLDQALRDLDDARFSREGARHNLACFLSQQAAEKAVKGLLVFHGDENILTHSVANLCDRSAAFVEAFKELRYDGASLDVFYIPTRYPNGLPGGLPSDAFGPPDSERAIASAERIIESVQREFGPPEPPVTA